MAREHRHGQDGKHRARLQRPGKQCVSVAHYAVAAGDPLGTLPLGELTLIDGGGIQLHDTRFGDYSQMTIDPSDDCTFWYTGTYYPTTSDPNDWHTRIGSFRFTNCHGRDKDSDK